MGSSERRVPELSEQLAKPQREVRPRPCARACEGNHFQRFGILPKRARFLSSNLPDRASECTRFRSDRNIVLESWRRLIPELRSSSVPSFNIAFLARYRILSRNGYASVSVSSLCSLEDGESSVANDHLPLRPRCAPVRHFVTEPGLLAIEKEACITLPEWTPIIENSDRAEYREAACPVSFVLMTRKPHLEWVPDDYRRATTAAIVARTLLSRCR